jgi:hypothetical protein
LAALLAVGGAVPAAAESTYDIHGVVTFQKSPEVGVRVCDLLTAICDETDNDGRYALSGLGANPKIYATPGPDDSAWIETWYGDYSDSSLSWLDLNDPDHRPESVDIHLLPVPTITGTVVSATGASVGGAKVCVEGSANCVTANVGGRYRLVAQIPRGDMLTLVATAPGYRPATKATSVAVGVKITLTSFHPPRVASSKPKLVGTKKVGKKLRVQRGSWGPGSLHFSYRWYRNGHRIAGAARSTYRLTWADWRKNITVKVVATKPGYRKAVRTSRGTGWIRWSEWHRG